MPLKNFQNISPQETQIGWVGTGVMGCSMAGHLLAKGYRVTVHNRTKEKAKELLSHGAVWADSPRAVAAQSDVMFTMVGFPDEVKVAILGEQGVLAGAKSKSLLIDMTSTKPSLSLEIFAQAKEKGVDALDAPVSGGDIGAREATLSIMVGGERVVIDAALPLLQILGKNIVYQGKAGSGQHAKLCNQIVIAGTMIGVCEALLYGAKAGLDLQTMLASISKGAAGCWTIEHLVPRILKRNFDPGFMIDHFIKDMGIALEEAKRMQLNLSGLSLVHRLYTETQRIGHGRLGTHALMLGLEKLSHD